MPEAGRAIIQDQISIDGSALPWKDRVAFAELMLNWELRSYREAAEVSGAVFFDRGIPDVIGYLSLCGLDIPLPVRKAAEKFRYNKQVFLAPPWQEIFHEDAERKQSWVEAEATFEAMLSTYKAMNYEIILLPLSSIEERADFIAEHIIEIRPAKQDDVETIFRIRCAVKENHMSREELAELGITPDSVREMIMSEDYCVSVAFIKNKMVGFAIAQISQAYLSALFVHPEHESRGIGRTLMNMVENNLIEQGVKELSLVTGSEPGIRAPGFYTHLGWTQSGIEDDGQLKFRKVLV